MEIGRATNVLGSLAMALIVLWTILEWAAR